MFIIENGQVMLQDKSETYEQYFHHCMAKQVHLVADKLVGVADEIDEITITGVAKNVILSEDRESLIYVEDVNRESIPFTVDGEYISLPAIAGKAELKLSSNLKGIVKIISTESNLEVMFE